MAQNLQKIVLIGGGALALEVTFFIQRMAGQEPLFDVTHVVDARGGRRDALIGPLGGSLQFAASVAELPAAARQAALVCVGDPVVRARLFDENHAAFASWPALVHPTALVAPTARLGAGVIVGPHVYVGPQAQVEDNALLNIRAGIGHDAVIGRHAVISPHAVVNGFGRCGECSFMGVGAILVPSAELERHSKLSAGSVLKGAPGDGFLLHGNPATGRRMYPLPSDTA